MIAKKGKIAKRVIVFLFLFLGLITIFLIFLLNGILRDIADGFLPPPFTKGNRRYRLAVIYQNNYNQFWQSVKQGIINGGKNRPVHLSFYEARSGQELQVPDYLLLASLAKYDGIIIHAEDERVAPLIQDAWNNGIPSLTVASDLPDSGRIGYVGTDNYRAGYVVGKTFLRSIPGPRPRFAIISPMFGADTQMSVAESLKVFGFREAISSKGTNIPIWEKTEPTLLDSIKTVRNLLEKHPYLDGIYATYAEGTVAAARVIVEKNLAGRIHLIGHGDSPEIRNYISLGIVEASVVEYPYQIGLKAIQEMLGYLEEKKVNISNNIDVIILNRRNLDQFIKIEEP